MTTKRNGPLKLVAADDAAEELISDPAPPVAMMVPAVDPIGEYRSAEYLKQKDAQGEIALHDAREERAVRASRDRLAGASAECEARINAAIATRDRFGEMERQHREAERSEYLRLRAQFEMIVTGAEASLVATEPSSGVAESGETI